MEIKIKGKPPVGCTFTEINIGHVEKYNPNVKEVDNHYIPLKVPSIERK